jgi:hypothetical protein
MFPEPLMMAVSPAAVAARGSKIGAHARPDADSANVRA